MLPSLPFALLLLLDVACGEHDPPSVPVVRSAVDIPARFSWEDSAPAVLRSRDVSEANATSTILPLAISEDGSSYFTVIQAGNISFRISVDTASSDLWLLSSACKDSEACNESPTYPLNYQSPSFGAVNNNQTSFTLSFEDGSTASGFLATETVQLGNHTNAKQLFGLVNKTNVSLDSESSGILGLGFPRLSSFSSLASNSTPFVNGLAQQGLLEYPLFGLSLTRDDTGTLALGAIDANVVQNLSAIDWHKVMPFSPFNSENTSVSYLQWAIRLPGIGVNGTSLETQPTYPNVTEQSLALIDAGTNGIFGPYQDVSRIFEAIDEARLVDSNIGQWAVPCDTDIVLSFNFGQGNLTLQPTDLLIGPVTDDPTSCLAWPRAVQDSGDGIDWQLGTPFLRTVYSIFSYGIDGKEVPMIGFYPLSNVTILEEDAANVSSFFSSISATVATTLPNSLLSTPSASTPSYIFNTSVPATAGALVSSALGDVNYGAIFTGTAVNTSALPLATPPPTLVTFILTDQSGEIVTSTEHVPTSTIALGVPPGQSSGLSLRHVPTPALIGSLGLLWAILSGLL